PAASQGTEEGGVMDTSTDAFIEFVETDPGLPQWIIAIYRRIDTAALSAAADLLRTRDMAWLRARAADQCLTSDARARHQARIDGLERDPTGRLAVIRDLRAWTRKTSGSITNTHINWYVVRVNAWIDAQRSRHATLVPLQTAGH